VTAEPVLRLIPNAEKEEELLNLFTFWRFQTIRCKISPISSAMSACLKVTNRGPPNGY